MIGKKLKITKGKMLEGGAIAMTEQYHVISYKIRKTVKLEVGLHPDAKLGEARPYRDILPVAFYRSSIVHAPPRAVPV